MTNRMDAGSQNRAGAEEGGWGREEINLVPPPIGHSLSALTSSGWDEYFYIIYTPYIVWCTQYMILCALDTIYYNYINNCTHYSITIYNYILSTVQHTLTTDNKHCTDTASTRL